MESATIFAELLQRQRIVCGNTVRSFRQMILALNFDGLNEAGTEEDAKFQERMKLLKKMDSSTLLILDNIDEWPDDFDVFSELRRDSQIHIVITTRLRDKFDKACAIPVDVLAVPDQLKLFEYHLRCKVEDKFRETVNEILEYVDGHTLLIELIAISIDSGSLDYSEMLEFLRKGETSAELSDNPIQIQKDDYNKQDRMWHFVRKILFNIEPLSLDQQCTLRYLVLLPMDGISRTELAPACSNCRDFLDKLKQILAVEDASDFSEDLCKLIQSTVHTLSADFTRTPCAENMDFLVTSAGFYRKWKEYDYHGALDIYQLALPMLQSSSSCLCPETIVDLYIGAGWCYQQLADYKNAIHCYHTAADTAPEGSCQRAKAYLRLGEVHRKNSDYPKALRFDQLALEHFTKDFDIAEAQNAIGVVYINLKDYEKAKECYLAARERWEACLDVDPSDALYQKLAYANHNIGTAYQLPFTALTTLPLTKG